MSEPSEIYYSSDSKAKRTQLATYFENITKALEKINEIVTSESWQCVNATDFDSKFDIMKEKIPSINNTLTSYETFLGVVESTYNDASEEIDSAITTYVNE